MKKTSAVLRVAVPTPLRKSFDYLQPTGQPCAVEPGSRVRVSFGRSKMVGVVDEISSEARFDRDRLKSVESVLDGEAILPADLLQLCRWASNYYHHPIGEVYSAALPAALRRGEPLQYSAIRIWKINDEGLRHNADELRRAPRQAAIFTFLSGFPEGASRAQMEGQEGDWEGALRNLVSRGWVDCIEKAVIPEASAEPFVAGHALNAEQQAAVNAVQDSLGAFEPFLLYGVTGSGKTEVYLQCIEEVLKKKQQVLILVPEIGLTPQLIQRFQQRFSVPMVLFHSGLTDQERLNAWLAAREGKASIVIGTRSAVFTPLARPGLIVIDEEHDQSLKQQDGFRYSARDLAVIRARTLGVPIILGSATPSLESMHNARQERYHLLRLPERAGCAVHPKMGLLDVRGQAMDEGLSVAMIEKMQQHLQQDGQVLLFLNRRGFAPTLLCHDCGWVAECKRCDSHMTLHQSQRLLRCHHCGAERKIETHCPDCGSADLRAVGQGTERTAQALERLFPDYPVARIDRDTTRRKGSMEKLLHQAQSGEKKILLGTQLLAKGHHFPNVTLVGILESDHWLFSSDFRAGERMAQLLLQVAGRAGRADKPGEVLIQTHHPEHALLQVLLRQDYEQQATVELEERSMTRWPPYSFLALLRAEATGRHAPMDFLKNAAGMAWNLNPGNVQILGPVPSPMEKRAGRYRAQLLLQSESRAELHQVISQLLQQLDEDKGARKVRWSLDVDPQEMY